MLKYERLITSKGAIEACLVHYMNTLIDDWKARQMKNDSSMTMDHAKGWWYKKEQVVEFDILTKGHHDLVTLMIWYWWSGWDMILLPGRTCCKNAR